MNPSAEKKGNSCNDDSHHIAAHYRTDSKYEQYIEVKGGDTKTWLVMSALHWGFPPPQNNRHTDMSQDMLSATSSIVGSSDAMLMSCRSSVSMSIATGQRYVIEIGPF